MTWKTILSAPPEGAHIVQTYVDDDSLAEAVGLYAFEGLSGGDAVLTIATPEHTELFLKTFRALGIDVERAEREGRLTALDAESTLSSFYAGRFDGRAFERSIGDALSKAGANGRRVRAYGEMVDVLWRRGCREEAIGLEGMWNDLSRKLDFRLFCAYALDPLSKRAYEEGLRRICEAHTHVLPHSDEPVFEASVDEALKRTLGPSLAGMLCQVSASPPPSARVPEAQQRLLWLAANMPTTAGKVLSIARTLWRGG